MPATIKNWGSTLSGNPVLSTAVFQKPTPTTPTPTTSNLPSMIDFDPVSVTAVVKKGDVVAATYHYPTGTQIVRTATGHYYLWLDTSTAPEITWTVEWFGGPVTNKQGLGAGAFSTEPPTD